MASKFDVSTHQLEEACVKALQDKVDLEQVISIWHGVGTLVRQALGQGKGVRITAFGTFCMFGNEPLFQMATDFGRQNNLKQKAVMGIIDNIPIAALNYAQLGEMTNNSRDIIEKVVTKMLYCLGREVRTGRTILLTIHRCCEILIGKGELRATFGTDFLNDLRSGACAAPPVPMTMNITARPNSALPFGRQNSSSSSSNNGRDSTLWSPRYDANAPAPGESYLYRSNPEGRGNSRSSNNSNQRPLSASPRPTFANNNQRSGPTPNQNGDPRLTAAKALGTELIIGKIKQKIVERGGTAGIASVARLMKIMDDDGSRQLSRGELKNGLRDYGIDLTPTELEQVFLYFDRDRSGSIDIDEFLIGLQGEMNERRKAMVRMAFDILDTDQSGVIDVDEISAKYDFTWHPDVKDGRKTIKEAAREFMSSWETAANQGKGLITYDDFEDHYKGVSASIDNDEYFELMIRNAWRIPGGQGQAANTANRRVLVTDKNGRQTVQTVEQELGINARDLDDVRGRLGRQGLADVGTIQMSGGVDTTEKSARVPSRRVEAWGDNTSSNNNNNKNNNCNTNSGSSNRGLDNNNSSRITKNPAPPPVPPFDPFTTLKSLLYDPPVALDALGKKLGVSMVAHNPRISRGAMQTRLNAISPTLSKTDFNALWTVLDSRDVGNIEILALHNALVSRYGKDRTASKGGVIEKAISKILERAGANGGLKGLQKTLAIMDQNGDKRLDKNEMKYGLLDYGIELNSRELDDLFAYFDRDRNGYVDVTEFFVGVRGDLNDRRARLVRMAFDILDTDGSGLVTVDEISQKYDVSHVPEVMSGKITKEQAYREFMRTWDKDGNGLITYDEFEDYYKEVSASIDGDDYFELMMRNAWRIAGGQGQAANTANRRVLVTDKNGRQTVQTLEQELGMNARDLDDVRGRLGRQGLADVGTIEMYGGVDTTEKSNGGNNKPLARGATAAYDLGNNSTNGFRRPKALAGPSAGVLETERANKASAKNLFNARKVTNTIVQPGPAVSTTAGVRRRQAFEKHVAGVKAATLTKKAVPAKF